MPNKPTASLDQFHALAKDIAPAARAAGAPTPPTPYEQQNPVNADNPDHVVQTLRGLSNCPLPNIAQELNSMVDTITKADSLSEEAITALGDAVTNTLLSNYYCRKQVTKRTVALGSEDPALLEASQKIDGLITEATHLLEAHQEKIAAVQKIHKERWDYVVKTYGLSVATHLYQIDDKENVIQQVSLDCKSCTGVAQAREKMQRLTAALVNSKEPSDE